MNAMRLDLADQQQLAYALSKHIPSMSRGFTIHTSYGEIEIDEVDARPFTELLERKLNALLKLEQNRGR